MGTQKEQAQQLDSVTDRVQESELDASKAQQAMSALTTTTTTTSANAATVVAVVSKQDVELVMTEMEVTQDVAERALRTVPTTIDDESKRVVEALRYLVTRS